MICPDSYCYICGSFTPPKQRRNISEFVRKVHFLYLKIKLGDQDKPWAPHNVCHSCEENLRHWTKGSKDNIKFSIPMVWREPPDHVTDCYFCLTKVSGFNGKARHLITYPIQVYLQQFDLLFTQLTQGPFSPNCWIQIVNVIVIMKKSALMLIETVIQVLWL